MTTTVRADTVLESGDRLTRAEFHRRYCAHPEIKKAELILGVVYVGSPVRAKGHGQEHVIMSTWIGSYALARSGLEFADNATVFLLDDTEPQPDVCLFRTGPGATAHLTDEGYIEGTPDLAIEVAASSASYDLHDKKEAYRRARIPEYLVWRTLDRAFHWFRLTGEEYLEVLPDARGLIESTTFPELRHNIRRLLAGDYASAIAGLSDER